MTADVSVIIAAWNARDYLGEAIESVIGQTAPPRELFVIDDGSTDDTAAIAGRYCEQSRVAVRLIRQENQGLPAARNAGIREADGKWIAFLDADDVWQPDHLSSLLGIVVSDDFYGVRFANAFSFGSNNGGKANFDLTKRCVALVEEEVGCAIQIPGRALFSAIARGNFIPPSAVMVLNGVGDAEQWFDPMVRKGSDRDLFLRLATRTGFAFIDRPTVALRIHDSNMSQGPQLDRSKYILHALRNLFRPPYRHRLDCDARRALEEAYRHEIAALLYRGSLAGPRKLAAAYILAVRHPLRLEALSLRPLLRQVALSLHIKS